MASGGSGGTYGEEAYDYDANTGNLWKKGPTNAQTEYTYQDAAHKHAVTHLGGAQKYWYEANGNMITRIVGGNTYTLGYDDENRLTSISGAATASFAYDGDGNRVKGTVNGVTTTYIGNYFEWSGSTSSMKRYYYAGGVRIAMRVGSTLSYLFGDHLGSTAIMADSSGVKTAEVRYGPWGTDRYTSGTMPTTYRYTGQRFEASFGLYFYNVRWYDPALGRWVQPDTDVPESQGDQRWDRFAYVNNNPVNNTDPSGHATCTDDGNCGIYSDSAETHRLGLTFSGTWTERDKLIALSAVGAVADKIGSTMERFGGNAFKNVYGNLELHMGCPVSECGDVGGITDNAHLIRFSALDSGDLQARNNVVHELGHAFNALYANGKQPSDYLGYTQTKTKGYESYFEADYPNRADFPANHDANWVGPNVGYASGQNQFTWQQSYSNAGSTSEEFADQFLGWTFNTWETNSAGSLTIAGQMRSNWMNKYMPEWLK